MAWQRQTDYYPRPVGHPSTVTNDIIGNILRVLYDGLFWARNLSEGGRERPLLVVMEEAHSYLGDDGSSAASIATQRIVRKVASMELAR